jgi:hypothetical protein
LYGETKEVLGLQRRNTLSSQKSNVECSCWYTLIRNKQVEDGDGVFDIRQLPRRYRHGQELELDLSTAKAAAEGYLYEPEKAKQLMELRDDVHRDVFRRAIDDGYDFDSAACGNYSQFLRRLDRWVSTKFRGKA